MGKGKGTFEFWATRSVHKPVCRFWETDASFRVPIGRVIIEIGGTPVREELARDGSFTRTLCVGFPNIMCYSSPSCSK